MNREEYLDALLGLPRLLFPQVSDDGKWVAWAWLGVGPAADVYAAPTDGSAPPVRLTSTEDNTFLVGWTPDSKAVIVSQDHHGDERDRLFRIYIERPETMEPLTEEQPQYFLHGGTLHPNGRWLVYAANIDVATGREIEATWVYRHDLETGERTPLAKPQRGHYFEPDMNRQGTHVLYTRNDLHPAGQQVWMVDIEGEEDREAVNVGAEAKAEASWMPDGRRAVVLADTKTHTKLGVWDRETGETRWLIDDPSRNIGGAFAPNGIDRIVVVEVKNAGARASFLDPESGEETALPPVDGSLIPLAPVGGGEWVGQYYSAQQPADLVRFSPDNVRPEGFASLTKVWDRTSLSKVDLAPAQSYTWKSVDGLDIQGWLYRPKGQARGTIVYVHGGPTSHSENRLNAQVQYFVSQGFNVLDPNYRGSTGFSLPFREAIREDGWGGREQDDIRTGIESLINDGIAERGKVGMTGTSYGGYSSWCGITRFSPDVLAASAPVCGMTDLVVDYQTTRPDLRPYSEEMLGGSPDQVPERYHERSPIHFVSNIKGRLLIVQGEQDPNVTPANVHTVEEALKQEGIPYELLTFPDEGHGIYRPANQRVLYTRLVEFFEDAFKGSK